MMERDESGSQSSSSPQACSLDSELDNADLSLCQSSPSQSVDDERRRSEQLRKLFVGGLASFVTDDVLKQFFLEFGEITDVVVMKDSKTGRSRGFGFVTFREPEMVDAAQAARPHILGGKQVETKRAMPREDSDKPEAHMTVKKLFVGALKKAVTSEDLRHYFSEFGNVEEAEVMTWKETGESRGFGFVTFDDYDPVDKCILFKPHSIRSSRADVKKALSKEEMSKVKAKQEQQKLNSANFSPTAALKMTPASHCQAGPAAFGSTNQPPLYYPAYPPGGHSFPLPNYSAYHVPPACATAAALAPVMGPFGPVEYIGSPYALQPTDAAMRGFGQLPGAAMPPPPPTYQLPAILHSAADSSVAADFPTGLAPRWNEVYQ